MYSMFKKISNLKLKIDKYRRKQVLIRITSYANTNTYSHKYISTYMCCVQKQKIRKNFEINALSKKPAVE